MLEFRLGASRFSFLRKKAKQQSTSQHERSATRKQTFKERKKTSSGQQQNK
jgi:hypothetical protein